MFGPSRNLSVQLLWPLLTPDQSRWRLLAVALWPSLRSLPVRSSAAGSLPQRPDHSVEQRSPLLLRNVGNRLPIRSPQVRTRCFRAQALHLPCPPYPVGFVMGCQLARRPGVTGAQEPRISGAQRWRRMVDCWSRQERGRLWPLEFWPVGAGQNGGWSVQLLTGCGSPGLSRSSRSKSKSANS